MSGTLAIHFILDPRFPVIQCRLQLATIEKDSSSDRFHLKIFRLTVTWICGNVFHNFSTSEMTYSESFARYVMDSSFNNFNDITFRLLNPEHQFWIFVSVSW